MTKKEHNRRWESTEHLCASFIKFYDIYKRKQQQQWKHAHTANERQSGK